MKLVVFALLLLTPLAARAASPAETYLAARDGYLAKFKEAESGTIDDSVMKQYDLAIADLENQLTGIIGPFEMKGIPTTARSTSIRSSPATKASGSSTASPSPRTTARRTPW